MIALVSSSFLSGRNTNFVKLVCLSDPVEGFSSRTKKLKMAWRIIANSYVLVWQIIKLRPDLVFLDSYSEYLSPLWIDPHIILSRIFRVRYAANLHDPVRSYQFGPLWWHKLSVWLAYQILDFVLVHNQLPHPSPVPERVKVLEAPVGVYEISACDYDKATVRSEWGVKQGQTVFLSFGYVRDGKNLDLVIKSLRLVPKAFLVIVGSVASSNDRTFNNYRELAEESGVAERCRFFEGFVTDEELGKYFVGSDIVLLTYSSSFHSQSGVLNIAVRARRQVLASAAPSPLLESVMKYKLGFVVEPDSVDAIVNGMRIMMERCPTPLWNEYEQSASWKTNASVILAQIDQ